MKHLAIIADGNRHWAKKNHLPEWIGYQKGLETIERCCLWCINNQISYLTVYCLSTENWQRGEDTISMLFSLADRYLVERIEWYIRNSIQVCFSGRRDRLKEGFSEKMELIEKKTRNNKASLTLVVCVDYGGRDEIARAIADGATTEAKINEWIGRIAPSPDAILRTGGQHRLSNFLLWQSAYAELFFLEEPFPDLSNELLNDIKQQFEKIQRNFGK